MVSASHSHFRYNGSTSRTTARHWTKGPCKESSHVKIFHQLPLTMAAHAQPFSPKGAYLTKLSRNNFAQPCRPIGHSGWGYMQAGPNPLLTEWDIENVARFCSYFKLKLKPCHGNVQTDFLQTHATVRCPMLFMSAKLKVVKYRLSRREGGLAAYSCL